MDEPTKLNKRFQSINAQLTFLFFVWLLEAQPGVAKRERKEKKDKAFDLTGTFRKPREFRNPVALKSKYINV